MWAFIVAVIVFGLTLVLISLVLFDMARARINHPNRATQHEQRSL
jgi:hypothetical protein